MLQYNLVRAASARALLLAGVASLSIAGAAVAQETKHRFDIPAQSAVASLQDFAKQSGKQVLFPFDAVGGKRASAVSGVLDDNDVLQRLAAEAGLVVTSSSDKTVTLQSRPQPEKSSQGSSGAAAPVELEAVTITANKREENLQKASVAVTAIGAGNLKALGVTSAIDLTSVVPNLSVTQYGNGAFVAMRGVVSTNNTVAGDPAVAYAVDGVDLVRNHSAVLGMFDIDRVEVLRGPQGTLQGRNATAGSIGIITAKPHLDSFAGSASIGTGNYGAFSAGGMINVPISDTLGFRAAINHEKHDGYVDTAPNPRRFNDLNFIGGRIHLLWKPTADFSALLTYDTSLSRGAGNGGSSSGAPLGKYATDVGAQPYKYQTMPGNTYLNEKVTGATLTLNWSLPFVDVTYIGNQRRDNFIQAVAQAIYGPASAYCKNLQSVQCFNPLINSSDDTQTSHELRFSKNTERLNVVVGGYFLREIDHYDQAYEPNMGSNGLVWRLVDTPRYFSGSQAYFGQATWHVTDRLRLVAGARHTKDTKDFTMNTYLGPVGSIVNLKCNGCTLSATSVNHNSWAQTTWRAGVDFDLSPTSFLFGAISTGYKAGGITNAAPPHNFPYGPENLTNYEIGSKNMFLDNRLQVNVDAYYMIYKDYQASSGVLLPNGTSSTLTVNAGRAVIKGVELETTFLLTPQDRLSVNGTVLDATFTNFFLAGGDGFSPGAAFRPYDLSGIELPYAPHNTARVGYEHTFNLANDDTIVARVDSSYTSHQFMGFHNFAVTGQDAYTRTGLSVTWNHGSEFSLQAYVRNVEDKAIIAGVQDDQQAPGRDFNNYAKEAIYMAPRTYGIKFSADF